jgi:hypothetical protein
VLPCPKRKGGRGGGQEARAWVEAGADVNVRGPDDVTPLMLAAQGWPEIVRALLAAGADGQRRG